MNGSPSFSAGGRGRKKTGELAALSMLATHGVVVIHIALSITGSEGLILSVPRAQNFVVIIIAWLLSVPKELQKYHVADF